MADLSERIILGNLPMFHAFGMCVFLTSILEGSTKIVLIPRFTEQTFLSSIQVVSMNIHVSTELKSDRFFSSIEI